MKRSSGGRILAHHRAMACIISFPLLLSVLSGCREQIPAALAPEGVNLQFRLSLNSYYIFDNWFLDPFGSNIPGSKYRTSWRVVDTGAVVIGYPGVTDVVESTFVANSSGSDSLVRIGHRYFRTDPNGDVFEYDLIARLFQMRDSIQADPQWDKILSPSAGINVFWTVETSDSPAVGTIEGRFLPQLETLADSLNGIARGVLAYHTELAGANLTLGIWVGGSPPAILRTWDQSDVLFNRIYQELRGRRTE